MKSDLQRAAFLTGYGETARLAGLAPKTLLRAVSLPIESLADPELQLPFPAVTRLLETTADGVGMVDFGLRMVENRHMTHLGVVALLARDQPTVRAAVKTFMDRMWMMTESFSLTLEETGGLAILTVRWRRPAYAERQVTEVVAGVIVQVLRTLIGPSWRPQAVLLPHSAPRDLSAHRRVLRTPPTFRHDTAAVALLSRELDAPLTGADVEAARILERHMPPAMPPRLDPVSWVRDLAAKTLPDGRCSNDDIAAHMGMDTRTLHRRLAQHGTTFSGVVDDVRAEMAERLLRDGRSLTEISDLLGYASLSAFSRWHTQRHGVSASSRQAELTSTSAPGPRRSGHPHHPTSARHLDQEAQAADHPATMSYRPPPHLAPPSDGWAPRTLLAET